MKPDKQTQYGFYLLSMTMFFVAILILGTDIPVCFEDGAEFIGIKKCLTTRGIVIPFVCLVAFIIICRFTCTLRRRIKGTKLGPITIKTVSNVNNDIMAFVGSYFLPIVSFNVADNWRHFLVLSLLFVLIGVIYVKSDIYYANPTLLVLGYRVYRVDATLQGNEINCIVIIHDSIKADDQIMYIPIDDKTFYGKKM